MLLLVISDTYRRKAVKAMAPAGRGVLLGIDVTDSTWSMSRCGARSINFIVTSDVRCVEVAYFTGETVVPKLGIHWSGVQIPANLTERSVKSSSRFGIVFSDVLDFLSGVF